MRNLRLSYVHAYQLTDSLILSRVNNATRIRNDEVNTENALEFLWKFLRARAGEAV